MSCIVVARVTSGNGAAGLGARGVAGVPRLDERCATTSLFFGFRIADVAVPSQIRGGPAIVRAVANPEHPSVGDDLRSHPGPDWDRFTPPRGAHHVDPYRSTHRRPPHRAAPARR